MINDALDWCDGHHIVHWVDGGATCLDNSVLVCRFHHRLLHKGDWTVHIGHHGRPEFTPPAWIDPHQRPRRNVYHRRR
ncbi:MAG TPA: HNH endonuclease signature motif containing protein [Micromonosporaceae bacterium]|nr:HNH endonuclease signature motif containing protein [Micromonosporaceae bacterium]